MKHRIYGIVFFAVSLFAVSFPPLSVGQTEIEMDRGSLRNLQPLYTSVYLEAPASLADLPGFDVTAFSRVVDSTLAVNGIPQDTREPAHVLDREPYLSIHINAMDMENGLIPFAIEAEIIQGVYVANLPDEMIHAATWDSGLVGLVSRDNIDTIRWAVVDLVEEFAEDYHRVNPM